MGRIKDWFDNHEILGYIIIVIAIGMLWGLVSDFCGKTYDKLHHNKQSYSWSIAQFKRICEGYSVNEESDGIEYYKYYDSRSQAINDFMALARSLDGKYANGKFRHIYIPRNERIYQCCDRNGKLIAVGHLWENIVHI